MTRLGDPTLPLRVAIIGSGPSGFYAADALLNSGVAVSVSLFDRLPTPYGLVRAGVAPDHPKIKNVIKVFERIAALPACSFWGNVYIGKDIGISELRRFFDVIVFAYGAEKDRILGVPNETISGSHTATAFVGWYNGHPDYCDCSFDLSTESVVIIGQGNVALDVCRILAKPVDSLAKTDIANHALERLAESRVREIHVVGRRGPAQAKFTAVELKELMTVQNCQIVIEPSELQLDAVSGQEITMPEGAHARANLDVLNKMVESTCESARKTIFFHFLLSPVEFCGDDHLTHIRFERNRLEGSPFRTTAVGMGQHVEISCGLLLKSVGYRGVPIDGVPFNPSRGVIPTEKGLVVSAEGTPCDGLYACGWIKRGPHGVIGTNKPDAAETVRTILESLPRLAPCPERSDASLLELLTQRGIRVVSFDDWKRIDAAEIDRGKAVGKPREKFTRVADMLAVL